MNNKLNVPNNMGEILSILDAEVTEEDKQLLRSITEDDLWKYHHTVGRAMRNDWGLWQRESPLHQWFYSQLGIWHADDMSGIIMTTYHRYLKNIPFDLETQAKFYINYWQEAGTKPYN